MKRLIYTAVLFFFTSISFSQYFMIYEFESENQDDTMGMFDLMMTATKEVVGKDLNIVSFQKELSNTHFLVEPIQVYKNGLMKIMLLKRLGAQIFQKLSGVENIQEKLLSMQKATDSKGARLFELLPEYSNMAPYMSMSTDEKKNISIEELFFMI